MRATPSSPRSVTTSVGSRCCRRPSSWPPTPCARPCRTRCPGSSPGRRHRRYHRRPDPAPLRRKARRCADLARSRRHGLPAQHGPHPGRHPGGCWQRQNDRRPSRSPPPKLRPHASRRHRACMWFEPGSRDLLGIAQHPFHYAAYAFYQSGALLVVQQALHVAESERFLAAQPRQALTGGCRGGHEDLGS